MKTKDKIHDYNINRVIYQIDRKENEKDDYVGETGRPLKERLYEHKIVTSEEKEKSHTLVVEIAQNTRRTRSEREIRNYRNLHNGEDIIMNPGESEVARHMVEHEHGKYKMNVKIIGREENNWKRGIKEAIEIKRKKPTLNQDDGKV